MSTLNVTGYYHIHNNFNEVLPFVQSMQQVNSRGESENSEEQQQSISYQTCPNIFATHSTSQLGGLDFQLCNMHSELQTSLDRHQLFLNNQNKDMYQESLTQTRDSVNSLKSRRHTAERAVSELKAGDRQLAYVAMRGECVNTKDTHFTYNVCLMEHIHQNDDEGDHGSVKLGACQV